MQRLTNSSCAFLPGHLWRAGGARAEDRARKGQAAEDQRGVSGSCCDGWTTHGAAYQLAADGGKFVSKGWGVECVGTIHMVFRQRVSILRNA
jgi:hypothetical protein